MEPATAAQAVQAANAASTAWGPLGAVVVVVAINAWAATRLATAVNGLAVSIGTVCRNGMAPK